VFCSPAERQAVEIAFSGEKIVSLAQRSFCSNHDIPPSIDPFDMRRRAPECKVDALSAANHASYGLL
jgi:hypothetical protein